MSIDSIFNDFQGNGPLESYRGPETFDGTLDFNDTFGFSGDGFLGDGPLELSSGPTFDGTLDFNEMFGFSGDGFRGDGPQESYRGLMTFDGTLDFNATFGFRDDTPEVRESGSSKRWDEGLAALDDLKESATKRWDEGVAAWDDLKEDATKRWNAGLDRADAALDDLQEAATERWDAGLDRADAALDDLQEAATKRWDAGLDTADASWDGLKDGASYLHGVVGQNLFDGVIRRSFVFNPYPGDAKEAWGETFSSGLDTLGAAWDFGEYVWSTDADVLGQAVLSGLEDAFESNFLTDSNGDGRLADDRTRNALLLGSGVLGVGVGYKLLKDGPELLDAFNNRLEPLEAFHDRVGEEIIGTAKDWAKPINQRAIQWEREFWEERAKPFFEGLRPDEGTYGRRVFDSASDGLDKLGSRYNEAIASVNTRLEPYFDALRDSPVYQGVLDNGYKVGSTVFDSLETWWTRAKYVAGIGIGVGVATGDVNVYVNRDDVVQKFNVYPGGWNATVEFAPTGSFFGVNGNSFYWRPPWPFENSGMPTVRYGSEPNNPSGPKGITAIDPIRVNGPQVGLHAQWLGTNDWAVRSAVSLPFSPFLLAGYSWPFGQFQLSGRLDIPVDSGSRAGFHLKNTASTVRPQWMSGVYGPGWSLVNKDVDFADLATIFGPPTKGAWVQKGPLQLGAETASHGSSSVLSINPSYGVPEPTNPDWNLGTWVNSLLPESLQGLYGIDANAYDPTLNTQRTDQRYLDWLKSGSDMPPPYSP